MPSFGENLRELRKSRGYSQDKFAKEIGSNQMTLSSWEVGTRMPALSTIKHIADTFKVPLSSLISLEGTGIEEDGDRELLDLIHGNQRIKFLLNRSRYLSDNDLDLINKIIDRLTKEKP